MVIQPIDFPFYRSVPHTIGQLRQFAFLLAQTRKANQPFSSNLRSNKGLPWAKLWNEELSPLLLLGENLAFSDEDAFEIAPTGSSGPDIRLRFKQENIGIQITIADLEWGREGGGGRTQFLEHEILRQGGVAWGGGGTRKDKITGSILSSPTVLSPFERVSACRSGLWKALERKAGNLSAADWLLVYARDFQIQTIDEGFEPTVAPVIESFTYLETAIGISRIFVVTQENGSFYERKVSQK